jgi:putative MFS transporter
MDRRGVAGRPREEEPTRALGAALGAGMFMTFLSVSGAYTVQTEVFPTEVKSLADGMAFSLNRIANFAFGALAPVLLYAGLLSQYLAWVGVFAIASGAAAAILGMETSRRELERLEEAIELRSHE